MPRRSPTAVVFVLLLDLMILGQSAFRIRQLMSCLRVLVLVMTEWVVLLNMLTNLWLTTPCPVLGLLMLVSVARNWLWVLIMIRCILAVVMKLCLIRLVLFLCSSLRLMNI